MATASTALTSQDSATLPSSQHCASQRLLTQLFQRCSEFVVVADCIRNRRWDIETVEPRSSLGALIDGKRVTPRQQIGERSRHLLHEDGHVTVLE